MSSSSFAPSEQGSEESMLNNRDEIIIRDFDQAIDDCKIPKQSYDQIYEMIEEHKANKEEKPLMISKNTVKKVLQSCGVDETRVTAFEEKYDTAFGTGTEIRPQNIVDTKQFELRTADVTIKVNPERSDLIKSQIINGTKYILIRADENVEVNGVNIHIS